VNGSRNGWKPWDWAKKFRGATLLAWNWKPKNLKKFTSGGFQQEELARRFAPLGNFADGYFSLDFT
jgi:hypothetical protein